MAKTATTTAAEIMTTDVVTINFDATLHETLDLMISDHVTTLPVISASGKCIGMISLTDLLEVTSESEHLLHDVGDDVFDRMWVLDSVRERLGSDQVHTLMSDPPIRIAADASVEEAASTMLKYKIHHLPVISSSEKLVGLISSMDLLRLLTPGASKN